jgi:DNA gyrase inhibitor GyrI
MSRPNVNLKGQVVILNQYAHTGTTENPMTRIFRCKDGNGCDPNGMGTKIFGNFLANPAIAPDENCTIDARYDIERIATQREIELATT